MLFRSRQKQIQGGSFMNNTITIIGHVGKAPEILTFSSGKTMAKFSVAVNNGDNKTLWFAVQAWNEMSERVVDNITKGREVLIQGRLGLETYKTKKGESAAALTIRMTSFHLCGKKPQEESSSVKAAA